MEHLELSVDYYGDACEGQCESSAIARDHELGPDVYVLAHVSTTFTFPPSSAHPSLPIPPLPLNHHHISLTTQL